MDNLLKVEVKMDLSESVNKTVNNIAEKPSKEFGKTIGTMIGFFNNTILYPMQKYNLYAQNKLENYAIELENRAENIPKENLIESSVNILGPAMEGLKYNLDEEHIKEMFMNILIADMDKSKKSKVLPAYIDIVKQLSQDDARFLLIFKEFQTKEFYTIELTIKKNDSVGIIKIDKYLIHSYIKNEGKIGYGTRKMNQIILDNLIRLNLIELNYDEYYTENIEKYDTLFNSVNKLYKVTENQTLSYNKGMLKLTEFGSNLVSICFN